jgi:hypothetical protein
MSAFRLQKEQWSLLALVLKNSDNAFMFSLLLCNNSTCTEPTFAAVFRLEEGCDLIDSLDSEFHRFN